MKLRWSRVFLVLALPSATIYAVMSIVDAIKLIIGGHKDSGLYLEIGLSVMLLCLGLILTAMLFIILNGNRGEGNIK